MKRSVLIGLLGAALANSALAALLPVGVPPGLLSHRHSDDGEGLAVDTAATSTQPSVDTHVEAHEQGHGANSSTVAGSFDPSKLYGPEGEVMEPVPGINAPPSYHHHQSVRPSSVRMRSRPLACVANPPCREQRSDGAVPSPQRDGHPRRSQSQPTVVLGAFFFFIRVCALSV